jgi:protein involved in polysaccharide export with SLBB domain
MRKLCLYSLFIIKTPNMRFIKSFFTLVITMTFSLFIYAQDPLGGRDLSTLKVDALSDNQITAIQQKLKQSGFTIDQVESQAIAKGMSPTEFTKLKDRLNGITGIVMAKSVKRGNVIMQAAASNSAKDSATLTINSSINSMLYGSELFATNSSNSNAANKVIATPLNYEIGPNDVIKLVVYGVQEHSSDLTVSKEGKIQVDNVGQIKVAGLTIEAAKTRIKQQMAATAYSSLARGESKLDISLGDIRTIHITVIGAYKSGTYNVTSLSNVISALSEAGGPNAIGSYREIEVIRNNKIFTKVDLYRFLQYGDQSQNIGLKDNDIIRVPAYKNRIELTGEVKRPGIFEVIGNESFSQILEYAGGFSDNAYSAMVKIIQKNDKEKSVKDLSKLEFGKYQPKSGDVVSISKIINRYQNRVVLSGAVYRPDVYELQAGMRIADLINKADGLKEDAFTGRAQLIRTKPNLLKEMISINLSKALEKNTTENILLQREDELYINSILEIRDSLKVDLFGEVKTVGSFNYIDSMTVKDIILMAGGFTYAANKNIEVARLVQYGDKVENNQVTKIFKTEINGDLSFNPGQENIVLQPLDVITITKKVGYTLPEVITISGQVQSTGKYTLSSRVERVSDIVKRAGGLIGEAYGEGAYIKRKRFDIDSLKSDETKTSIELAYTRKFKAQQEASKNSILNTPSATSAMGTTDIDLNPQAKGNKLKDTLNALFKDIEEDYYQIAIDINYIMKHPGSELDLVLRGKDEIVIPKMDNRVKVSGGVLRPTNIVYREGLTVGECISAAGGISEYAKRGRAYVIYANGKSNRTKIFGIFRVNPVIRPGAEVVIPETDAKKDKAITTIVQFTTVIAQIVAALATVSLLQK